MPLYSNVGVFSSCLNAFASDMISKKDKNFNIVVIISAIVLKHNFFVFLNYLYLHPIKNWD